MSNLIASFKYLGGLTHMIRQVARETFSKPIQIRLIIDQIYHVGVKSFTIVMVVVMSTGMVMALQFGAGLEKFGGKLYVPNLVTVSIVRELGPVLACLMIAARIGAGFTSEIGSMKVTQQIDAIRALGTSPIKKIVVPRVLASMIAIPLLSVFATTLGVLGGLMVGATDLGLDPNFYFQKILWATSSEDYFSGFFKTFFFAFFISTISCFNGLKARDGTQGVGAATTRSVVIASVVIMIGDYFLTKLFLVVEAWL